MKSTKYVSKLKNQEQIKFYKFCSWCLFNWNCVFTQVNIDMHIFIKIILFNTIDGYMESWLCVLWDGNPTICFHRFIWVCYPCKNTFKRSKSLRVIITIYILKILSCMANLWYKYGRCDLIIIRHPSTIQKRLHLQVTLWPLMMSFVHVTK